MNPHGVTSLVYLKCDILGPDEKMLPHSLHRFRKKDVIIWYIKPVILCLGVHYFFSFAGFFLIEDQIFSYTSKTHFLFILIVLRVLLGLCCLQVFLGQETEFAQCWLAYPRLWFFTARSFKRFSLSIFQLKFKAKYILAVCFMPPTEFHWVTLELPTGSGGIFILYFSRQGIQGIRFFWHNFSPLQNFRVNLDCFVKFLWGLSIHPSIWSIVI